MISVDWLSQWLVLIGIDRLFKSIISIDWLSQWFDLIKSMIGDCSLDVFIDW